MENLNNSIGTSDHVNGNSGLDARQQRMQQLGRTLNEQFRRTNQSVIDHPYFTAGIVAGIGLAIGGVVAYRARQKQAFFDRVMRWF